MTHALPPPEAPPPATPRVPDALGSEQRFEMLVQGVTDYAIYMIDPSGYVTNWNAGAQRIKGYAASEIVGQHFERFFTDEDRAAHAPQRALEIAAREGRYEKEGWRVRKDGSRFRANVVVDAIRDADGHLLGYAKVTRDITERWLAQQALERAQSALHESQKLEAIGRLTGGVAHDFNNLLTVIVNNLALIARLSDDPRIHSAAASGQRAAAQGAKLTRQLLAYARRQPLQPRTLAVTALIGGFATVLARACGETVSLELDVADTPAWVHVDAQQFQSALLNLIVNGCDAMPSGGRLTVATRVEHVEQPRELAGGRLQPARYVVIEVRDTGIGMSPAVRERAFEPFFTTKDVGKGTGLGLSQVGGFASQSGGAVDIESALGKGCSVRMYLPLHERAAADAEQARGAAAQASVQPHGRTALLVEDDPDVRAVAVDLFRDLGFEVLTAGDGREALQVLESPATLDLMFSDVVMPGGLNGVQLARRARVLRPALKIVLASGYPMDALRDVGEAGDFAFVAKPYGRADVAVSLGEFDPPHMPA